MAAMGDACAKTRAAVPRMDARMHAQLMLAVLSGMLLAPGEQRAACHRLRTSLALFCFDRAMSCTVIDSPARRSRTPSIGHHDPVLSIKPLLALHCDRLCAFAYRSPSLR